MRGWYPISKCQDNIRSSILTKEQMSEEINGFTDGIDRWGNSYAYMDLIEILFEFFIFLYIYIYIYTFIEKL